MSARPRLLALLVISVLAGGCMSLPDSGPVTESQVTGTRTGTGAMAISPVGPRPGQSATQIVKGFLDAMQATPIDTTVAQQFLTAASRDRWSPTATITYVDAGLPRVVSRTSQVAVSLTGAVQIDARGAWLGALDASEAERTFRVVREGGEFRIADPPDVLIVPQYWFAQRFRQVSLYFFDPTAQVLVPDPVFVPREVDLATILVRRLVAGPGEVVRGFVRSAVPLGADADLTVPVSSSGVATVNLTGTRVVQPGAKGADLMVAQLAWTLRQDPSVTAVEVLINGVPLLPVSSTATSAGERYAPYIAGASPLTFALRDGLLVQGVPPNLVPAPGPFGTSPPGLRSVSPDLTATRAAGVSVDGTTLLIGPMEAVEGGGVAAPVWQGAAALLDPAWDFSGRVWAIDRGVDGARVGFVSTAGLLAELPVPGVSGEDVKSFLVSRDGSRLVAVLRRPDGDQIVVSRLLQNPAGRVVRAEPAQQVDVEDGRGLRIRDIAWLTPTSIVVLHPVGRTLFRVRSASLDGAPAGPDDLAVTLEGQVTGLIGSPDPELDVFAVTDRALIHLAGPGGNDVDLTPGLINVGYAG
jgi:hypothetical protein